MNTCLILSLIIGIVIACCGCQKQQSFTLTQAKIMSQLGSLPGKIYFSQGAKGPYSQGPGMVGNENTEGSFFVTTKRGKQSEVSWPATPGYYYETASYINQAEEVFYVVRKIPYAKKQ